MKKILLLLLLISCVLFTSAQKEANVWAFGTGIGLNFNSIPPSFFPLAGIDAWEGSTSIADTNGNLLFYTDGYSVWNKNQQVMPNGTGLMGANGSYQSATSCTHAAIAIRQPGSYTQYYIFTVPERSNAANGMRYSIVDMTLDGGLGAVTAKNVLLFAPSSEKVAATYHSNQTDVWVVGFAVGTDKYRAYKLTATGVDTTAVVSTVDTLNNGDYRGQMKFSLGGKRLGNSLFGSKYVSIYDFNNTTGAITNPIRIHFMPQDTANAYGLEFSPDESKLYLNHFLDRTVKKTMQISQYDLSSGDPATINNSQTAVGPVANNGGAGIGTGIQLGPDNKIYCNTKYRGNYIDVINNPNAAGAACNYQVAAITTDSTHLLELSLPTMLLKKNTAVQAYFTTVDTLLCQPDDQTKCISFSNFSLNATSYKWYFPGATPSGDTTANPTNICYSGSGEYSVTLVATNGSFRDSITFSNYIKIYVPPAVPVITRNADTLFAPQGYTSYVWTLNSNVIPGASNYFYVAAQDGRYYVTVTDTHQCTATGLYDYITGLGPIHKDGFFHVYPNPASDRFTIHYPGTFTARLINSIGQIVEEKKGEKIIELSTVEVSNGIYSLQIMNDRETLTVKVLVQH